MFFPKVFALSLLASTRCCNSYIIFVTTVYLLFVTSSKFVGPRVTRISEEITRF